MKSGIPRSDIPSGTGRIRKFKPPPRLHRVGVFFLMLLTYCCAYPNKFSYFPCFMLDIIADIVFNFTIRESTYALVDEFCPRPVPVLSPPL